MSVCVWCKSPAVGHRNPIYGVVRGVSDMVTEWTVLNTGILILVMVAIMVAAYALGWRDAEAYGKKRMEADLELEKLKMEWRTKLAEAQEALELNQEELRREQERMQKIKEIEDLHDEVYAFENLTEDEQRHHPKRDQAKTAEEKLLELTRSSRDR